MGKQRQRKPKLDRKAAVHPQSASALRRALLRWFDEHGRHFPWRSNASVYRQVIAELLLQRTRADTVSGFFEAFITRFPSWEVMAAASADEIAELLKPIGLWKRRSKSLAALAKAMVELGGIFPPNREDVQALPGIGQYIANAILLFSAGQAEPLLDVNMARVLERVFRPRKLVDIRYDPYLQRLARQVVKGERAAAVNWAILDLAATICTVKNPMCGECPLRKTCRFAREGVQAKSTTDKRPHA
jgi:A/G-specific adenine glycosylase